MSKVLVILEVAAGKLRPHCLPGITAGAEIAAKSGGTLQLLVLGADPGQAAQAIAQAGYGATGVLTLGDIAKEGDVLSTFIWFAIFIAGILNMLLKLPRRRGGVMPT